MHKKLLLISLATFVTSLANAEGPEVKLSGGFDVQVGYLKNNGTLDQSNFVTANNKNVGFNSTGHMIVDGHNTTEAGLEYGAKLALATAARNSRKSSSSIYFISQAGKWEFGTEKSATSKMRISAHTNACATAGGWDAWVKTDPAKTGTVYITSFSNFVDAKTRNSEYAEYSRKVTYYTPEFYGLQLGLSYIPDTTNAGYAAFSHAETHEPTKTPGYTIDVKNAFAGGVTYENKISDDTTLKVSLVGEVGKAVGHRKKDADASTPFDAKFKKLRSYKVGTQLDHKEFSFSAGYANYLKSLTSVVLDNWHNKNTDAYGFTGRYNHPSNVSASLTYFASRNKGNDLKATTFAMEYKVMPGIMPYAEVTYYKTKGKYQTEYNSPVKSDKNSGVAVILGTKLEF